MKTCNTRVFENKIAVGEFYAILREDFVIKIDSKKHNVTTMFKFTTEAQGH